MHTDRANGAVTRAGSLMEDRDGVTKGRAFLSRFLKAERRIFAYILTLLPHRADAEDVHQEVILTMWEKFDEHDPPADFAAWGCRIAYFRILEYRRSQRRSRLLFSDEMLEQLTRTITRDSSALQLEERREALAQCIGKLGPRDRELLVERLREGATARSTADRVGRSVDAVYKALARIRKCLYDCIARSLAAGDRP